jgi:hypothetical protein
MSKFHLPYVFHWTARRKRFECGALVIVIAFVAICCALPANSQSAPWTELDINDPPLAGSFSYNGSASPPTYTVVGSGSGSFYGSDQLAYANTTTATNIEMEARIVSETSTTTGALGGLMIRANESLSAPMGGIAYDPGLGSVNFYSRSGPTYGPAVSLPIYVRLVRSGNTITGYYSADNQQWTQVGSITTTNIVSNLFYTGFIAASNSNTATNTVVLDHVSYMTSVPQPSSNLLLWLRSDAGIHSTAGLSEWDDQSGNGNNATQTSSGNQPTYSTGALNSSVLPTVSFNGTSSFMNLPSNFANLNAGCDIFIVGKSTSSTATGNLLSLGNTSNSDAVLVENVGTQAKMFAYNGTTSSSVVTTDNPLSTSSYQLIEEQFLPGTTHGTGTIFVNQTQHVQSTSMVASLNNITRSANVLGAAIGGTSGYFQGGIAEVLVFSGGLSSSQRASIASYVLSKYGIGGTPTADVPTFSPGPGVVPPAQQVSILQDQNAIPWFTLDGSTPIVSTLTGQWFINTNPIVLRQNTTINALANAPFFNNSADVSAAYTVESASAIVPRNGMSLWLRGDYGVTLSGSTVQTWSDASGSLNTATQATGTKQPTYVASAVNGLPALTFASGKYMQLPTGFSTFAGASIFAVIKPTSVTAGARIIDLGNGATSDNIQLQEPASGSAALYTYNGSTGTNVTASGALTLNTFQLLEAIDTGTGTATLFTNSTQEAQNTSMGILNNLSRSANYVAQGSAGGNNFVGQIAELIVYSRNLSASETAIVENYLYNKYALQNVNTTQAPTFSQATATYTAPLMVAIEAPADSTVRFTTDGTTPTSSSPTYSNPINVLNTQTVKAIAIKNGVSSAVTSATYTLDATQFPAPASTTNPLQLKLQLPHVSIPQDSTQP